MKTTHTICALAALLTSVDGASAADAMPRSGSFAMHTAFKGSGEMHQVTDSRTYLFGTWLGISYNAAGTGPLHAAPVVCGGYTEIVDGGGSSRGLCTFGDGADRIHGEWSGSMPPGAPYDGSGRFTAGTGKFAGITGGWSFRCRPVNLNTGQWTCDQKVDYRLP